MKKKFRGFTERFGMKELEYLASEELIYITPSVPQKTFHLLSGDFGPLKVGRRIQVPIWLALKLHEQNMCVIEVPEWMKTERLTETQEKERQMNEDFDITLPYRYYEVGSLLLKHAKNSFTDPDKTHSILSDVFQTRKEKLMNNLKEGLSSKITTYRINISSLELNLCRDFLCTALNIITQFEEE